MIFVATTQLVETVMKKNTSIGQEATIIQWNLVNVINPEIMNGCK